MTTYNPTNSRDDRRQASAARERRRGGSAGELTGRRRAFMRAVVLGTAIGAIAIACLWFATSRTTSAAPTPTPGSQTTVTTGSGSQTAVTPESGTHAAATPAPSTHTATSPSVHYQTGPAVTALQRDLGQLNYYESTVDGVYGPATTAAVKDFQRANGLTVDGIAGSATMAKIQQQLITGDSQMGGSGTPAKPAAPATSEKPATPAPQPQAKSGGTTGGSNTGGAPIA